MKPLPIVWQRLVSEGQTCPRCGATQQNVEAAVGKLVSALRPLGLAPTLEVRAIDHDTYRAAPAESNRIWIGGAPIEALLGGGTGGSLCCAVCGDVRCRTLVLDGHTYESIPEDLIVKAALVAALRSIEAEPPAGQAPCCSARCACR